MAGKAQKATRWRPDADPAGAVQWKAVEATFRRTGKVLHLRFPGGELIRTTPEHPFWVEGIGWTPAGSLKAGDRIATLSGEFVALSEVYDTGEWEVTYNLRVAEYHTYFVGDEGWGFAAWAHNMYSQGDTINRTKNGVAESIKLPAINMNHLTQLTVDGTSVSGFHVMPSSAGTITSTAAFTLAAGVVTVLDTNGNPITGAQVRVTPLRVPVDTYDAFEAKIEVLDASGLVIASDPAKSFYPQAWSQVQIREAIYAAYAEHYRRGGYEFFRRDTLSTSQGVAIEMRVRGSQSASGVTLRDIPTAYPRPLQRLTASNAP